jgi:DNA-binding transcriptional MerR regulator
MSENPRACMMEKNTPPEIKLPDKLYFKIGEVSAIVGLPPYVLRFWETEFTQIKPKRTASGQRLYTKSDVAVIIKVKYLLYEKKFTIPGARQHLKPKTKEKEKKQVTHVLSKIRQELESIRDLLDR